ncbi:hypothetical protein CRE_16336 [Caenorhabditis remanei]|uniref:Uncharacterized protein n=1 Tax=Caenorhabditis remanei TaxID=31234 RepID=E3N824_CAERE|nr:hypothetical protein CRE_16336 [Caenorhabditis remanei]
MPCQPFEVSYTHLNTSRCGTSREAEGTYDFIDRGYSISFLIFLMILSFIGGVASAVTVKALASIVSRVRNYWEYRRQPEQPLVIIDELV